MNRNLFILLIGAISSIGLISSDLYLPAFPSMAADFRTNPTQIQLSLSMFLLALSFSQLFYGILSEILGRKQMLLLGLCIYILGSALCRFAPNVEWFILARVLQGFGACAGLVLGRTIVSDLYSPKESASIIAIVFPIVALSPALSPLVGSVLLQFTTWKALFVIMTLFGLTLLCLVQGGIPESKPKGLSWKQIPSAICEVISDSGFWAFGLVVGGAYAAYFVYITEAPFLFQNSEVSISRTSVAFVPISISYVLSTLYARRWVSEQGLSLIIGRGSRIIVFAALLMIVFAYFDFGKYALIGAMALLTLGNGFILSYATAAALSRQPERRGIASGVLGTTQFACASIASSVMGAIRNGTPLRMAMWILFCALLAFVGFKSFSKEK